MNLINLEDIDSQREEVVRAIQSGAIFIYPTDTIYGLGCNASLDESVQKIRRIKHRDTKPFSVIAPSKEWIEENCLVESALIDQYLPGPYTLFVRRKGGELAQSINPNDDTLGVRIPDHWFTQIVEEAGVPFVTTSVNVSGERHMEAIEELGQEIRDQVDYVVYEGVKRGSSSQKINLVK